MKKIKIIFSTKLKLVETGLDNIVLYANSSFATEIAKFKCYARLMEFINDNEQRYIVCNNSNADIIIDMSDAFNEYSKNGLQYDIKEYIQATQDTLDYYGNNIR